MHLEPTTEHTWLQKLLGNWRYEHDMPASDDRPATTIRGTETFRAIGGLWVQGEANGPTPEGADSTSIMTLGFDPAKKRYVGTWIGTMMPNLWVYDGEVSADGRKLSLFSEGPAFDGTASLVPYMDVVEFVDDNHRTLKGHSKGPDGTWQEFMTVHYYRT